MATISSSTSNQTELKNRVSALVAGETDVVAKMATISCELYHWDRRFDWVGFYRVTEPDLLKIGPYQGSHGCLTIPFSRGVCGACARTREVQVVADVDAFEGHIACSTTTRSEVVLPVFSSDGGLIGVLDIDSNLPNAFTGQDVETLTDILNASFTNPSILTG